MLAVTNARMKNISLLDRTTLDNELKSEFGEGNYELLSVGEGFLISVNNVEYLVDKDGKYVETKAIEAAQKALAEEEAAKRKQQYANQNNIRTIYDQNWDFSYNYNNK